MTTTNLNLATPSHGSEVDTWDQPVNDNSGKLDAAIGSVTTKSLSSSDVILTETECRVNTLRFTGTLTANVAVVIVTVRKAWIVENLTTGNFVVTLAASGNAIGLPPGRCQAYWDGSNVEFVNLGGPVGSWFDYPSTAVPAWISACTVPPYLLCNGGTFSAVTYPQLNQLLGGNTLPDHRGRFRASLDGGTSRITSAGSGVDGSTRFAAGGSQNQIIAQGNLPNYTLPNTLGTTVSLSGSFPYGQVSNIPISGTNTASSNGGIGFAQNVTVSGTVTVTGGVTLGGSGTALTTMPPTLMGGITMIRAG